MRKMIGPAAQLARLLDAETFAHSLRVAAKLTRDADVIVALLHDVVEDTELGFDDVLGKLSIYSDSGASLGVIMTALDAVTRRDGETYYDFLERAAKDEIGRRVKLADVLDHLEQADTLKPSLRPRYERALSPRYERALSPRYERALKVLSLVQVVVQADAKGMTLSFSGDLDRKVVVEFGPQFNARLADALVKHRIGHAICGSCFDFPADSGVPNGYRNLSQRLDRAFALAYPRTR